MCGLAGLLTERALTSGELAQLARKMSDTLVHRGPDAEGVWVDAEGGLALAHRRLSILDLSPRGRQPMSSHRGRWVVSYNGEIYNFRSLRAELEPKGHAFAGGSDTEVLLAAVEQWGPVAAANRFNGMFAFALWDREERALWLGRDRVGKKPLYYGRVGGALAFASELKAVRALPDFAAPIDRDALYAYLRWNAVPGDMCIYEGFHKLEPGTLRRFRAGGPARGELTRYWSAAESAQRGATHPLRDPHDALEQLEDLLRDAVRVRLESDVPLGAFLSGGIDSSLVVALMQAQSSRRVKTFTIGFHVPGFNEAEHAAAVARHLGTEHTELYLTAEDAQAVVPHLPEIYDEPFCDSSQIPTYLVAKLARQHVTVALSGDGGDELFAGYSRYPAIASVWRRAHLLPKAARRGLAAILGRPTLLRALGKLRGAKFGRIAHRDRVALLGDLLCQDDPVAFYRRFLSVWRDPVVRGARSELPPLVEPVPTCLRDTIEMASFVDLIAYLPDDILVKVDRATMAVSLESRAPLLDYRVVELASRFPISMKRREGRLKWPLQQLAWRHIPRAVMDRPKMGFGVPIAQWLRGPLREWAGDLLTPSRLQRDGYFDTREIDRRWTEHARRDWSPDLWAVLMFQAWLESERSRAQTAQPSGLGQMGHAR
ncbi:MAG: asparagine synthase (glutamine-hydrolyzing) [Sandaracinaceae bacterium]|nr:asparagine synthase (glutamine-hydrolyzing) [Sandaracinaceae bacterium]